MGFESLLFPDGYPKDMGMPPYFYDLHLDKVVDSVTDGKEDYDIKPFFYHSLRSADVIRYRQKVMSDFERGEVLDAIRRFSGHMAGVREYLKKSEESHYNYQQQGWFLDGALLYCRAVMELKESLGEADLRSEGLRRFLDYLVGYTSSEGFLGLLNGARKTREALDSVQYSLFIKENKIRVQKYGGEPDYGEEILNVFARFEPSETEDIRMEIMDSGIMNHVEAKILEFVAKLYSEEFGMLEAFCTEHVEFVDKTVMRFDRESQFYIAYLEYINPLEESGLKFCYPEISDKNDICDYECFDIALAHSLLSQNRGNVVPNDFYMGDGERIFVITGPNQGGKTTFARAFGQINHLFSLGLKVPGRGAKLFVFDGIYTHFEREEKAESLRGKLEDELIRMKEILDRATSESIIIMNEAFSSTSLEDALFLARGVLKRILELDAVAVFVTFMYELSTMDKRIVSLTSTVKEDNVTERTYRIVRRVADGLSYAVSLAKKHCLTYDCLSRKLKERLQS